MTELDIKHPGPIETSLPIVLFPSKTELTSINDPRPPSISPLTSSLEESATGMGVVPGVVEDLTRGAESVVESTTELADAVTPTTEELKLQEEVLKETTKELKAEVAALDKKVKAQILETAITETIIAHKEDLDKIMKLQEKVVVSIIGKDVDVNHGKMTVQRVLLDGFETVEMPLPAVATVSNELGEPRYPKLQQIMQAAKKTVNKWSLADFENLDASQVGEQGRKLKLEKLFIPTSDS